MTNDKEKQSNDGREELKSVVDSLFKESSGFMQIRAACWEKAMSENQLISQRTTWFITFQSFLFAGVALTISQGSSSVISSGLVLIFSILGFITAKGTKQGIEAAHNAIDAAHATWIAFEALYEIEEKVFEELKFDPVYLSEKSKNEINEKGPISVGFPIPPIRGAGTTVGAGESGKSLSRSLPAVTIRAWIFIGIASGSFVFYNLINEYGSDLLNNLEALRSKSAVSTSEGSTNSIPAPGE